MKLNLEELKSLDFSDIGNWPLVVKITAIALLCAAVLAAGFWFDIRGQLAALEEARKEEQALKDRFEGKQHKVANLDDYKKQMEEMERSFGTMVRQLPSKTEIAELLVDVSQTGLSNGLEFELFQPKEEKPADFYAELPIKITVTGDYHQFGNFVSDVAMLPRIVTLHDIVISESQGATGGEAADSDELTMQLTAKTYRYLEEE